MPMVGESETVTIEPDKGVPTWYVEPQQDTDVSVYGTGTGSAIDLQFAIDKAMHQAKVNLGDKLSTIVSAEMKGYTNDTSSEMTKISKTGFRNVDVSKYRVAKQKVAKEGEMYRVYVMLKLNRSDAFVPKQDLDNL